MISIQLTKPSDLSAADWQRWVAIAEQSEVYSSPYFRPEFTQAVARVRDDVEIALLVENGQTEGFFPFQRGSLGLGKPVGGKLCDYHGPIVSPGLAFDPTQLVRECRLASWDFEHLVSPTAAFDPFITVRDRSPQLDVSQGYEAYVQARRAAGSDTAARSGQKLRKLGREIGEIRFTFDADDPEAYDALLAWKAAQYERTGLANLFDFPWTRELLTHLRSLRGGELAAPLSVLRAGGQVAAVMLSLRAGSVLHAWFPAYNPHLAAYSPGVLLLLEIAQAAPALGIRTIDLGRGDERYKWSLASTSREVAEGTVAIPSLSGWLRGGWRRTRDWVKQSALRDSMELPARLIRPVRQWMAYH